MAYGANLFRQLEVDSLRARFKIRGATKPPAELVLVDIEYQCYVSDSPGPAREADLVFVDEPEIRGGQATINLWALPDPESPVDEKERLAEEISAFRSDS